MNFYVVLGIPPDADEETIRNAYRILARRYHPDRGAGSSAEKFRQVNEAYETLVDSGSRHAYDLSLESAKRPPTVRVEPMVVRSRPFWAEDPGVFGRFERAAEEVALRPHFGFHAFVDEWFDSWDDLFFGSTWPWW